MIPAKSGWVFAATNHHTPSCHEPPCTVTEEPGQYYYAYFESSLREQWVYVHDLQAGTGILRGGDIGWDTGVEVTNGVSPMGTVGSISLESDEAAWLRACWAAATGNPGEVADETFMRFFQYLADVGKEDPAFVASLQKLAGRVMRDKAGQ